MDNEPTVQLAEQQELRSGANAATPTSHTYCNPTLKLLGKSIEFDLVGRRTKLLDAHATTG